jgi:hypothetical protein
MTAVYFLFGNFWSSPIAKLKQKMNKIALFGYISLALYMVWFDIFMINLFFYPEDLECPSDCIISKCVNYNSVHVPQEGPCLCEKINMDSTMTIVCEDYKEMEKHVFDFRFFVGLFGNLIWVVSSIVVNEAIEHDEYVRIRAFYETLTKAPLELVMRRPVEV